MATEALSKVGLYIDAFNTIRLLPPELADSSNDLCEKSKEFISKLQILNSTTTDLLEMISELSKIVENEKLLAISSRNLTESKIGRKPTDIQQLQVYVREKQMELARLEIELEAVRKEENEQKEQIQRFLSPQ
ncbi:hypothetical protein AB6A40_010450 [Gnathostoma spinigerum]|uniref:DASH complex subunit SPC19 n=1 Tax=Gnathostoma spinigerum TaxID=75299 RepID=A0ABD6F164_9BILA